MPGLQPVTSLVRRSYSPTFAVQVSHSGRVNPYTGLRWDARHSQPTPSQPYTLHFTPRLEGPLLTPSPCTGPTYGPHTGSRCCVVFYALCCTPCILYTVYCVLCVVPHQALYSVLCGVPSKALYTVRYNTLHHTLKTLHICRNLPCTHAGISTQPYFRGAKGGSSCCIFPKQPII